ncbi:MAG: hypothetical protein L6271_13130, partial [Desulfobacteraceae bacterium]|nr:hypothetical protein [Desulfobacteraceae bacterium]
MKAEAYFRQKSSITKYKAQENTTMERATGFEPARPGWRPVQALKACVLPLHYTRSMRYFLA